LLIASQYTEVFLFFLIVFVTVTWCGRGVESVDIDGRGHTHAWFLFALEICEGEAADLASVYGYTNMVKHR
jgi:hypothetical protein